MEMEIIKQLISCKMCENRLVDPVILPCGETICNHHVKDQESDMFKCVLCSDQHQVPSNGFAKNKQISRALENNIDRSTLGEAYSNACENTEKLGSALREYELVVSDKDSFIYEFFSTLRNKTDLNVEQFRSRFEEAVANHRQNIDLYEKECRKNMVDLNGDVTEAQQQFHEAACFLRALHLDKPKWELIANRSGEKHAETQRNFDELKNKMLLEKPMAFLIDNFDFRNMIHQLANSIDPFRLENDDKLESELRERLFDGVYSLQSVATNKYICSEPDKRPIVANRDRVQIWERFQFGKHENDLVSIKLASNDHYWSLNDKDTISTWNTSVESINNKFRIIFTFFDKDIIGIQPASKNLYLTVHERDLNKPILVFDDTIRKTSMFRIKKLVN